MKNKQTSFAIKLLKIYGAQFHNQNSSLVGGGSCTGSLAFSSEESCNRELWFPPASAAASELCLACQRDLYTGGSRPREGASQVRAVGGPQDT